MKTSSIFGHKLCFLTNMRSKSYFKKYCIILMAKLEQTRFLTDLFTATATKYLQKSWSSLFEIPLIHKFCSSFKVYEARIYTPKVPPNKRFQKQEYSSPIFIPQISSLPNNLQCYCLAKLFIRQKQFDIITCLHKSSDNQKKKKMKQ